MARRARTCASALTTIVARVALTAVFALGGLTTDAVAQAPRRATFDFTGDGTSDLLFANDASLAFWDFDANGVINVRYLGPNVGEIVGAGDYDGDGTADLLTRATLSGATGYWPVRNGMLGTFVLLIADTSPNWHIVGSRQRTDLNGDGRADILWRHDNGDLGASLLNTGGVDVTWVPLGHYPREWTVIGTGDFDGDGDDDPLWRQPSTGDVRYMRIAPSGATTWLDLGSRDPSYEVAAIADFDNDRMDDIYWAASPNATPAREGWWDVNAGTVDRLVDVEPAVSGSFYNGVKATGDYRGDRSEDLVDQFPEIDPPGFPTQRWASRREFVNGTRSGATRLLEFTADWEIVTSLQAVTFGAPPRSRRAVYDFTGDGTSDMLFRDADGRLAFWDMSGPPLTASLRVLLGTVSAEWDIVGVGDYDGDRTSDLLFRRRSDGSLGYWKIARGAMRRFVPMQWNLAPEWQVVSSRKRSDLNGDGRDDVLLRRPNGEMAMVLVTGDQPLAARWVDLGHSNPSWSVAGTADFTGDGRDDVLFRQASTGALGYARVDDAGFVVWRDLVPGLDAGWSIGALGDFNADGFDDMYFRNATTGVAGYWNMANGALTGFVPTGQTRWFPLFFPGVLTSGDYAGDGAEDLAVAFNIGNAHDELYWLSFVGGTASSVDLDAVASGFVLQ